MNQHIVVEAPSASARRMDLGLPVWGWFPSLVAAIVVVHAGAAPGRGAALSVLENVHSVLENFQPAVVVGDPNGTPPDTIANHIDPNVSTSIYAGVGSLRVVTSGTFIGSGSLITPYHVLTAAHVIDTNANGTIDATPANVSFRLNNSGNNSSIITASGMMVHPDWTGFNNPAITDDVAIIALTSPVPSGTPIYGLYTDPVAAGTIFTMVGYGQSGNGVSGYTVGAGFNVKRFGQNRADAGINDDEGSSTVEGYYWDFDGPVGSNNFTGGTTLGNTVETTIGGGDSGGPSFVTDSGQLKVAGVNTFNASFTGGAAPPLFGSAGGGMLVNAYADWIGQAVVALAYNGDVDIDGVINLNDHFALADILDGITSQGWVNPDVDDDTFVNSEDSRNLAEDRLGKTRGDSDVDDFITIGDILTGIGNFTGPGSFGKHWSLGDYDGDGGVTIGDILESVGNFTGPGSAGNLVDSGTNADLIYDPATGNVKLDPAEASGGIITGFELFNAAGGTDFAAPGVATFPTGGLTTDTVTNKSWTDPFGPGVGAIHDLGNIFPTGLDLTGLAAFLTRANYTGQLGSGVMVLDLVLFAPVVEAVPEPGTFVLMALGCVAGIGVLRRRRAAA